MGNKLRRRVNFDICTFCNHKCDFCSNPDDRTIKSKVNLKDFKLVMNNLLTHTDIYELGLSAKGEVLMNKDLTKIIYEAKNTYNIEYVYLSTNASLLTEQKSIDILEAGLDSIKISINGFNRENYKDVHMADDFDIVINNVKNLLTLKNTKYPKLNIMISSVTDKKENIIKNIFKDIFNTHYNLINNITQYDLMYTSKFLVDDRSDKITKKCMDPFDRISINSNLDLVVCCNDYFGECSFGSLLNNNFLDLYFSKKYEDLRLMHKTNNFPDNHLCKRCLQF